jgi:hypothetical protein
MNKPGKVQAISIMTLVNGILNIIGSLSITFFVVIGTLGFGLLCAPFTLLPIVLGIFEIIYGSKLLAENPVGVKPNPTMAILEICCILAGLVNSCVIGIVHLVFINDPEVKAYFESIAA